MIVRAKAMRRLALLGVAVLLTTQVQAQTAAPATSAGPGRIVCKSAASCELGIGTPAKLRYQINASGLPAADKDRLTKSCTAKAAPCIATVEGTEMGDPIKIKATKITWYN
jgi:hypothetical protein